MRLNDLESFSYGMMCAAIVMIIATLVSYSLDKIKENKTNEYIVYRANCNDTLTIKADTFRVFPRENKAYFVAEEETIAVVDSVNQIKRK